MQLLRARLGWASKKDIGGLLTMFAVELDSYFA